MVSATSARSLVGALAGLGLGFAPAGCSDRPVVDTTISTNAATSGSSGPFPDLGSTPDVGIVCGDGSCSLGEACETCPEDCSCPLPAGLTGCPEDWMWNNAAVIGTTELGDFAGLFAYFSWSGLNSSEEARLTLTIFDESVGLADAKANPWSVEHFKMRIDTPWPYAENAWLGDSLVLSEFVRESKWSDGEVRIEVYAGEGSWETPDPDDPPVLHGVIYHPSEPNGPQGAFAAPFCDAFISEVIPD